MIVVAHNLFLLERSESEHYFLDYELLAAATLHDIGLAKNPEYRGHEMRGVLYADSVLEGLRYSPEERNRITRIILSTNLGTEPDSEWARILKDADVSNLGSYLFWIENEKLRKEFKVRDMRGHRGFSEKEFLRAIYRENSWKRKRGKPCNCK